MNKTHEELLDEREELLCSCLASFSAIDGHEVYKFCAEVATEYNSSIHALIEEVGNDEAYLHLEDVEKIKWEKLFKFAEEYKCFLRMDDLDTIVRVFLVTMAEMNDKK